MGEFKGDLAPKTDHDTSHGAELATELSKVRIRMGKQPESGEVATDTTETAHTLAAGTVIIQLDGGVRWEVTSIAPREQDGRMVVKLANKSVPGNTLTKLLDRLTAQLDEPGSAWSWS